MYSNRREWLWFTIALTLEIVLLWLPFGFRNRPIAEEWYLFAKFDTGAGPFYSDPVLALRPLTSAWFYAAYAVSPDTLVGLHLLQIILFVGKGAIAYALVRRLVPDNRVLPFFVGVLFVIYPADTGLFNFRAVNVHGATLFYLLSLYMLIVAYQQRKFRTVPIVLLCVSLAIALLTYESLYPLVFLSPLVLVWLQRGISRRVVLLSGLWYALAVPLFLNLLGALFAVQDQGAYQTTILDTVDLPKKMIQSLLFVYQTHFYTGWRNTIKQVDMHSPLPYIAAAFGVLAGWIIYKITPRIETKMNLKAYGVLALGGVIFIGVSFLPYTVTTARFDDWRVFYLSAFGAALALGILFSIVSSLFVSYRRQTLAVLGAACIGSAMLHSLIQHGQLVADAETTRNLAADVITQVPRLKGRAAILILWGTNASSLIYPDSVRYVYQDYNNVLAATTCIPRAETDIRNPPLWVRCVFHADHVDVMLVNYLAASFPYNQVILFNYSLGGHAVLRDKLPDTLGLPAAASGSYDPRALIEAGVSQAVRARSLLGLP